MAQQEGISSTAGGRLNGSIQKTATAASNFALGAGWGTTASATLLTGSTDQRGVLTITSGGTGQSQATATVVFTYADGAYASAPFPIVTVTSNSSIDEGHVVVTSTTTATTITFSVLPVDTKIYILRYLIVA
jgi:hypothetical protein